MPDFDVIVIGGGSAGTSAARAASLAGARTAMINDGELGGLCILRGCMPTKAMLASAHAMHEATHMDPLGIRLEGRVEADFAAIMKRKSEQVARFKRAKLASIESQDYEVIDGRGSFAEGGGVDIGGRVLTARRYVIATGSTPAAPPIPGLDQVAWLSSDDVMRLEAQPTSLVVQGSGAIGLELAQFFARIGTEVLLVCRSPLIRRYDEDCGAELKRALEDEPRLEIVMPASIAEVRPEGEEVSLRIRTDAGESLHRAQSLLVATGRTAALDGLGLEHVGIRPVHGHIEHDEAMQTANPHVFVAGDSTGRFQILHLASQEGAVAGLNAAGAEPRRAMDYRLRMSVIFTDPPFAQVGETEAEARARGVDLAVAVARFPETGRAITMGVEHGIWKLFADRSTGEILGTAIVGPRADDLVHLVSTMMRYRGRAQDIGDMPWYHPTLSEVMINLERSLCSELEEAALPPPPPA